MLSRLQYFVEGFFEFSAGLFKRAGFSPNLLSGLGFSLTLIASYLYSTRLSNGSVWLAAVLSLSLAGYFDALDGAMARRYVLSTKFGGVLDSVLDRIGEIAVYAAVASSGFVSFGLALWAISAALMVSYVRARVESEGVSLKGVGVAERPERLLIVLISTVVLPAYSSALAWGVGVIAVLSSLTVAERLYRAFRILLEQKPQMAG